ncbi:Chitin synthase, class 2 [Entophlyctis luteolus]|nr:Chitin synthase, class 2 [Entophlyctis luteolus]
MSARSGSAGSVSSPRIHITPPSSPLAGNRQSVSDRVRSIEHMASIPEREVSPNGQRSPALSGPRMDSSLGRRKHLPNRPSTMSLFQHATVKTVGVPAAHNYCVDIPVPELVTLLSTGGRMVDNRVSKLSSRTSRESILDVNHQLPVSPKTDSVQGKASLGKSVRQFLGVDNAVGVSKQRDDDLHSIVTPSVASNDEEREFTHLRYTAAICDPNDFVSKGYDLRVQHYNRATEILIAVTMYNEDEALFTKTWKAILQNIAYICGRKDDDVWGPDGWKKIVVCIISDGRAKIHKRTLDTLGIMGVHQNGIIKTSVNGIGTTAHIFEYSTRIFVDTDARQSVKGPAEFKMFGGYPMPPVQVVFCLKEQNAKKINSHRWLFNAFGKALQPKVCILIDVGTKPTDKSIYHLWNAFDENPRVGGACGEIYVELGPWWSKLWNPLVAAQNFEYKISNILDKPFESCFGFISVLPGAFSAYRYKALQNDENGVGPLEKYFEGETLNDESDISKANMYLAEDRILCFELVSKRGQKWILKYVRKAKAETDVPDSIPVFMADSVENNTSLTVDPFYGGGTAVFIILKQLYILTVVLVFISSLGNRPQGSKMLYTLFFWLFAIIMMAILYITIFSLYYIIPHSSESWALAFSSTTEAPIMINMLLSLLFSYGIYLLSSVLFFDPWHVVTSMFQYLLLMPSFTNILMVYAFCNIHDISWGTKGDNAAPLDHAPVHIKADESGQFIATTEIPTNQNDIDSIYSRVLQQLRSKLDEPPREPWWHWRAWLLRKRSPASKEDVFKLYRTQVVLLWVSSNFILIMAMTTQPIAQYFHISDDGSTNPYVSVVLYSVVVLNAVRAFVSCLYLISP